MPSEKSKRHASALRYLRLRSNPLAEKQIGEAVGSNKRRGAKSVLPAGGHPANMLAQYRGKVAYLGAADNVPRQFPSRLTSWELLLVAGW